MSQKEINQIYFSNNISDIFLFQSHFAMVKTMNIDYRLLNVAYCILILLAVRSMAAAGLEPDPARHPPATDTRPASQTAAPALHPATQRVKTTVGLFQLGDQKSYNHCDCVAFNASIICPPVAC